MAETVTTERHTSASASRPVNYRTLAQQLAQALDRVSDYVTYSSEDSPGIQTVVKSDQAVCSAALEAARKAGLIR